MAWKFIKENTKWGGHWNFLLWNWMAAVETEMIASREQQTVRVWYRQGNTSGAQTETCFWASISALSLQHLYNRKITFPSLQLLPFVISFLEATETLDFHVNSGEISGVTLKKSTSLAPNSSNNLKLSQNFNCTAVASHKACENHCSQEWIYILLCNVSILQYWIGNISINNLAIKASL